MQQKEFEILLNIIEGEIQNRILYGECYRTLKEDRILLHDMGIFEKSNMVEILKNKISIDNLNIQYHNMVGIDSLLKNTNSYIRDKIRQFVVSTSNCGYLIICSSDISSLIGIAKNTKMNIDEDLKHQVELKRIGHPNKNICMFEGGVLTDNI